MAKRLDSQSNKKTVGSSPAINTRQSAALPTGTSGSRIKRNKPSTKGAEYQNEQQVQQQKRQLRLEKLTAKKVQQRSTDKPVTTQSSQSGSKSARAHLSTRGSMQEKDSAVGRYGGAGSARDSHMGHETPLFDSYSDAEAQEIEDDPFADTSDNNEEEEQEEVEPMSRELPEEFVYQRVTTFPPRTSSILGTTSPSPLPPLPARQLEDRSSEGIQSPSENNNGSIEDGNNDSDDLEDDERPVKRLRDCEGIKRRILIMAQTEFQVRICTSYAFPEEFGDRMHEWANNCWDNACERNEVSLPFGYDIARLITKRTSTIRGRIKDKAVALVGQQYGFREPSCDEDFEFNKQHAAYLLKNFAFIYKNPETSDGMYEHPIVQSIINAQFFSKRGKSEGVVYSAAFNPMPDDTIALIFTAVQFAIKQWATNGVSDTAEKFSESQWHPVYQTHLGGLQKWRNFDVNTAAALARFKQRLFEIGSKKAGFQVQTDPGEAFSDEALARAAAALRK
ncbi:hypothetical protein M422DRAFT_40881 [Sphaerobolus stellatus SS14]|nr:hypothetical protein M422DRAFT_40881 [Sphaerobolus stellatus SS14]